jgi:hypothetical protein
MAAADRAEGGQVEPVLGRKAPDIMMGLGYYIPNMFFFLLDWFLRIWGISSHRNHPNSTELEK